MNKEVKFKNANEMYDYITSGKDLWSPSAETFAFVYNDEDSICTYSIDEEEAAELDNKGDEFWGEYLGCGGEIYDSYDYLKYEDGLTDDEIKEMYTAMDFCEEYYSLDDWRDVTKGECI